MYFQQWFWTFVSFTFWAFLDSQWFYLAHGSGTAVRCSSNCDYLECASDDGTNCFWGQYGQNYENYEPIPNVVAELPGQSACPGWSPNDGTDACEELSCYCQDNTGNHTLLVVMIMMNFYCK